MANTVSHQWPPFFAKPKDQLVGQTIDRVDHSLLLHLLLTHQPSWVSSFLGWILLYASHTQPLGSQSASHLASNIISALRTANTGLHPDFSPQLWNGLSYCLTLYQASLSYYQTGLLIHQSQTGASLKVPPPSKGYHYSPSCSSQLCKNPNSFPSFLTFPIQQQICGLWLSKKNILTVIISSLLPSRTPL